MIDVPRPSILLIPNIKIISALSQCAPQEQTHQIRSVAKMKTDESVVLEITKKNDTLRKE